MKGFSDRSACVYAAAVAALILLHAPGLAAETAERPYNPPVGSRWIIESEANSDQARTDRTETLRIKTRAELTIDAKTSKEAHVQHQLATYYFKTKEEPWMAVMDELATGFFDQLGERVRGLEGSMRPPSCDWSCVSSSSTQRRIRSFIA